MAVLLPGAPDLDTYWRNLIGGVDAITEVPPGRWDPAFYDPASAAGPARADQIYCRRGGFVDDLAYADPLRFGIPPRDLASIEPDQLIALQVASAAIEDAGGADRLGDPGKGGVVLGRGGYIGAGMARLDQRLRTARQLVDTLGTLLPTLGQEDLDQIRAAFTEQLGPEAPAAAMGVVPNLVASRIAARLGFGGPAFTVDAACASSLVAVDSAVAELASGRCDTVLAGGVHHCHDITLWSVFSQLRALSRTQRIRPFDRRADGILIGEGTGVVVLRRLADAYRDGNRVYAVIRGAGVSSDGRGGSLVHPDPAGQAVAIERAWRSAGLDPREPGSVGMIEAHGTGTPAGDEAELTTLAQVFGSGAGSGAGPSSGDTRAAALGSVKAMIGHTMAAAGVAGLVKAALALHHKVLLPAVNCDEPHPAIAATRFRPLPAPVPWEASGPRRAGVNAFGFGGTNAHILLEEAAATGSPHATPPVPGVPVAAAAAAVPGAPAPAEPTVDQAHAPRLTVAEPELVLRLAAATPDELGALLEVDDAALRTAAAGSPAPAAVGARLGLVNPTGRRLAAARHAVGGIRLGAWRAWRGRGEVWASAEPLLAGPVPGRIAFVFPGLEAEFSPQLDDVGRHFGFCLPAKLSAADLGSHGTSVLLVSRVLDRTLRRMRIEPDALAGHSIGEWSAMFAAGMFDEDEVDASVFAADPYGGDVPDLDYASLACSSDQARLFLADQPDIVLSHDNAPQSTVVCGPPGAIADLAARLRRENVVVQIMPFRSGFHTPMLRPHLPALRARTDRLRLRRPARVELWSATTASRYPSGLAAIRELFVRHLVEPVLFRQTVEAMYAAGVRVFIQVGPGRLGGLVDGVLEGAPHLTIAANSAHRDGLGQLRRLAVALWAENGDPDFAVLDGPRAQPASSAAEPAGPDGAGTGSRPNRLVRLDLSAGTVAIDPARLPRIAPAGVGWARPGLSQGDDATPVPRPLAGQPAGRAAAPGHPLAGHPLVAWAERNPVAGELMALLTETADTAAAVLTRAGEADTARGPVGGLREDPTGPGWTATLRVSTATMPYLLDHALTPQPPDWPDLADRRPVVAATTTVQLMADLAREASGRIPVGVYDVRLESWLPAEPATDVAVLVRPEGRDRFRITFVGFATALVRVADSYPAGRPPRWPVDLDTEQPPILTGREFYRERWMFHGPAFQGVTAFLGHGPSHVRGVLRTSGAPGALLDAAGQLLGYWLRSRENDRFVMFPVRIGMTEFFGPEPPPGAAVTCHAWVEKFDSEWAEAHLQLVDGHQVWAVVHGWVDRRFDLPAELDEAFRWPQRHPFSRVVADGWVLATERWSDLAVREMVLSRYVGAAERAEYETTPPAARREWLLRRIAIKDAVRTQLWGPRSPEIFPVQIRVADPFGQCHVSPGAAPQVAVSGVRGFVLPPVALSVASTPDVAVACARLVTGPGLPRPPAQVSLVVEPAGLDAGPAGPEPPVSADPGGPWWHRRLAAARQAVARASGADASRTRIAGASRLASDPRVLTVSVTVPAAGELAVAAQHTVICAEAAICRPGGAGAGDGGRRIVAWTTNEPEISDETPTTLMGVHG